MAAIDVATRHHPFGAVRKLLALVILFGSFAAVAELTSPVSCERHQGSFSNGFSTDFDINRTDCRVAGVKGLTLRFWGVSPYVDVVIDRH